MSGGTFTITNGGVFGSMLSTPIINTPQSVILGMHNIVYRPVAIGEDSSHNVRSTFIDVRESVGFLVYVKDIFMERKI